MDLSFPVAKHQRHLGSLSVGDNVDRISKLPDEVLGHILSYLDTRSAVRTSVLSKRWEYVWTTTSNLDFSDQCTLFWRDANANENKVMSFKNYVDRVLFYHGWSFIQKCHLCCYHTDISPNIYTWVYALIMCNIQELIIKTGIDSYQELPRQLFTCKSLMVLKIEGMFVLKVPNCICFPCLKILSLDGVVYVDDASAFRLFSNCPVLEDLTVRRGKWDGVRTMYLLMSTLKRLCVHSVLCHATYDFMTVINAPLLEYLDLRGNGWNDYRINILPSLVKAYISGRCVLDLLNGISQVQHLVLTGDVMGELEKIIENDDLPIFNNLKKLELYVGMPVNWEALPDLLESSPNLEVLMFPECP